MNADVHAVGPFLGAFPGEWFCEACEFEGTLDEAIHHAVENQFLVKGAQA